MPRNVGFGRAANAGLRVARGDAALVLNQDAYLAAGAVGELLRAAKDAGAWIAGPVLLDEHHEPRPGKDRFPPPLAWDGEPAAGDGWRAVPWLPGAAMLLAPGHTDLRFDRRFFMYVEDEELCWRVWRDGGRVVLAERARAEHVGGTASGSRWSLGAIARRTVANRARMVARHAGPLAVAPYALDVARRRLRKR
jgi:GT2 family glycosyltransferase